MSSTPAGKSCGREGEELAARFRRATHLLEQGAEHGLPREGAPGVGAGQRLQRILQREQPADVARHHSLEVVVLGRRPTHGRVQVPLHEGRRGGVDRIAVILVGWLGGRLHGRRAIELGPAVEKHADQRVIDEAPRDRGQIREISLHILDAEGADDLPALGGLGGSEAGPSAGVAQLVQALDRRRPRLGCHDMADDGAQGLGLAAGVIPHMALGAVAPPRRERERRDRQAEFGFPSHSARCDRVLEAFLNPAAGRSPSCCRVRQADRRPAPRPAAPR
jgi:hypothetical protein